MKVVILAGGFGTRISEETHLKPKPMIEIGGKPIIWHIMKFYAHFGLDDFIICCGYKGYLIKEYFINYFAHNSDIKVNLETNNFKILKPIEEKWKITLIDTGLNTMTGGRLKRVAPLLNNNEPFCLTYGDGLSSHDINDQIKFHNSHDKKATVLAVKPPGRFGAIKMENKQIIDFTEKPSGDGNRVSGGYFILDPSVINYVKDDQTSWEKKPMELLAQNRDIMPYCYDQFWYPLDTLRDKNYLEDLWKNGNSPWKLWR